MMYSKEDLKIAARKIRMNIVKMIGPGKAGHLGGSCSLADIIAVLFYRHMRIDHKNPLWEDRDRLVLSKGHSALALYAALADLGYFLEDELWKLKKLGAALQGHPDMKRIPGIEANTGSLGQGLSIAGGMAAGAKLDNKDWRVYCILGDGELAEGQVWEAAMAAAHYKLDNLIAIIDRNGIQATGPTEKRFNLAPLEDKWKAFGWHVKVIDGHDIEQIIKGLECVLEVRGKPMVIIADTVKGKGVCFAENTAEFHNGIMSEEQYRIACRDLCEGGEY